MKLRSLLIVSSILLLVACSSPSLCTDLPRPELSQASAEAESGILAKIAADIRLQHGNDASGFRLLDGSEEALEWRLALIDSAVSSLDIQTYLWYPDDSGTLLLERVVEAANRGVRVRLIVDDLLTIGLGQLMYELQNHPNIEFRIFNPWKERGVLSRAGAFLVEMERLNRRMHDKLMVADGVAAIVGGRNIGDHYFGLSDAYNFHDLDLLGFGAIGAQASGMFDSFWNQVCLRPRDRFWDIPVPKIDSAFDNLLVPQPSWSPSTTQQLRKLVAAPYLSPNDWTPRLDAYFASPLALCARRVSSAASRLLGSTSLRFALHGWQRANGWYLQETWIPSRIRSSSGRSGTGYAQGTVHRQE